MKNLYKNVPNDRESPDPPCFCTAHTCTTHTLTQSFHMKNVKKQQVKITLCWWKNLKINIVQPLFAYVCKFNLILWKVRQWSQKYRKFFKHTDIHVCSKRHYTFEEFFKFRKLNLLLTWLLTWVEWKFWKRVKKLNLFKDPEGHSSLNFEN